MAHPTTWLSSAAFCWNQLAACASNYTVHHQ